MMGDPRSEAILVLNRAARALGDGSQTSASTAIEPGRKRIAVWHVVWDALQRQGYSRDRLAELPVSEQRRVLEDAAEALGYEILGADSPAAQGRERGQRRAERACACAEVDRLRRENTELGLRVMELETALAEKGVVL